MFTTDFLKEAIDAITELDQQAIESLATSLAWVRDAGGRLFILGNGGGAGHASHAVCDFRKLVGMEAYTFDCVSEITARVNDEGWNSACRKWLEGCRFNMNDALLVISVGGGDADKNISQNLIEAIGHARYSALGKVFAVVGRDGGYVKEHSDECVLIQTLSHTTPITEGLQSLILHLLVSHPELAVSEPKWESTCET